MKKSILIKIGLGIVLTIGMASCGNGDKMNESDTIDVHSPEIANVKYETTLIEKVADSIFMKNNISVELYYEKVGGDGTLYKVENYNGLDPEIVKSNYNVIRYEGGGIMYLVEMPNANGKPFENVYTSIYSETGTLLRFDRKSLFAVEGLSQFVESSTYYFDKGGNIIEKTYTIVDLLHLKKQVDAKVADDSPGRIDYRYYVTAKEFCAEHPFK